MDKQTIIDGVDVSGCEYWKGYCRIASLCDYSGHLCEVTSNCYYKQLKRKEQECESWKTLIDEAQLEQRKLEQQLDQLKAENKHLNELLNQALKDYDRTSKTLEEIKSLCYEQDLNEDFFACEVLQKLNECEGNDDNI